jgi:valyl-tRNA synthetase
VLIGKHVRRPLPREEQSLIPIIGDEGVDFEFGTGVLKVTPAHDKADFEIGQRHGLPAIDIMHPNGTMNAQAGPSLDGLDRFEARKRAAEILGELGLLEKEEPYQNNVGYSERADVPIEPRLSEQWFLKYPSVEQARACVERTDILGKSVRVVSTTGRVLAGGKMSELRKAALEFARQHGIIGSTIKNEDSGLELKIGRQSLTHAFSRTGEANIKAVVVLPELIRSAIWLSTEPHAPANPLFRAVHRFVACLAIEQTLYRVQITAKELADGTILYDHKTKKIAPGGKSLEAHLPKEKLDTQPAPNATVQVVQLVDKVNAGRISFHPPRWAKVYDHWMGNLQDWCISRQLWWGHRVPVWYRRYEEDIGGGISFNPEDVHVSVTPPPRAEEEWVQDSDVLDTWFSSWLWPFATMGWPEKTNTLAKFYPTTDLVTGPDIIFFWVARMIMAGFEYMGELPFKNVYFTGIIRDKQGRKMSKSLGNSPDPLDLIAKSGADALRFGVMRSAPLGADILFDEKNVELGRNFCTKLWNAARFRQMHLGEVEAEIVPESLTSDDKWILLRLDAAIREVSVALDEYRFSDAAQALYRFFWSEYCNWYLEASKAALYPSPDEEQIAAQQRKTNTLAVMDFVLGHTLRLFHPFLPFITEELWQSMGFSADLPPDQGGRTIMFAPWPKPFTAEERAYFLLDESDERYASAKFEVVDLGRGLRRDFKIASNKRVRFVFRPNAPLPPYEAAVLQLLLNAETLELVDAGWVAPKGTPAANTPLGELLLPLEGLIDVAAEHDRLSKEIVKAQDELARVEAKLANPNFAGKVPAAVLEEHQQRRASWAEKLAQLQRMLAALGE